MNKTLLIGLTGMLAVATSTLSMASTHEYRTAPGVGVLSGNGPVPMQLAWDARSSSDDPADGANDRRDPNKDTRLEKEVDHGMQLVPTTAGPGQPGHGWLFFSHPAADRAVVISPQGAYYYSQGEGPRLVTTVQRRF